MQYFIKAALGPNMDLNKISVYDPVLYENNNNGEEMRRRYQDCFSQQLHSRIVFRPCLEKLDGEIDGSAEQFVRMLGDSSQQILF